MIFARDACHERYEELAVGVEGGSDRLEDCRRHLRLDAQDDDVCGGDEGAVVEEEVLRRYAEGCELVQGGAGAR